jgi:hypothetical protein
MRLQEEYFRRHHIDTPLVNYCNQGSVILRTVDPAIWQNRWVLVTIHWIEHPQHPGFFRIDFSTPVHNGAEKSRFFTRLPSADKEWDEYEDFMLNWVGKLEGVVPVRGNKQIVLAAWEMFVYCHDGWFRRQSYDLKQMLFNTLDDEMPVNERYSAYQEMVAYFTTQHPALLKTWKYEMLYQVQYYSDWLARLIEAKCGTK